MYIGTAMGVTYSTRSWKRFVYMDTEPNYIRVHTLQTVHYMRCAFNRLDCIIVLFIDLDCTANAKMSSVYTQPVIEFVV